MNFLAGFGILTILVPLIHAQMKCSISMPEIPNEWIDLRTECLNAVRGQIQKEIDASYQYLAMGAHFSSETVNRPGFANIFFLAAREERDLASKLIEYLSTRGHLTDDVSTLIQTSNISKDQWSSGAEALEDALKIETDITKSIRKVIATCERRINDYHLVQYLTGEYLETQMSDQRNLAGKLSSVKKMMHKHEALGEFLFDKELYLNAHFQ